jgi:hypothetical protein
MVDIVHRPLKIKAFNANGIGRRVYEFKKQLQEVEIDVALFSERYLKPHIKFCIPNYNIYRIDCQDGHEGGTEVAIKKSIPHNI